MHLEEGEELTLDAVQLFGLASGAQVEWSQTVLANTDLAYATSRRVVLTPDGPAGASVGTPLRPAVYRFEARIGDERHVVDVRVTGQPANTLELRGAALPDLFETIGGPEFTIRREDPDCQATVSDHAFEGVRRLGAEWVGFVPAFFLDQLDPLPRYVPLHNSLSLTDDSYYAELIEAAKRNGLRVMMAEQDAPTSDLPEGDWELRNQRAADPEWLEAWFGELRAWLLPRAVRAETAGVELYALFNPADFTFKQGTDYDRHWRELIAEVRAVYSGEVGVWLGLGADERFTFADALDFALVSMDGSYFTGHLADTTDPSVDELRSLISEHIDRARAALDGRTKAYYYFAANSSDGQEGSEAQSDRARFLTDFQEQSVYYEAFFAALEEHPWVTGSFVGGIDWFDQYRRALDQWYFDATNEGSPRSKPAEQVATLWYSLY